MANSVLTIKLKIDNIPMVPDLTAGDAEKLCEVSFYLFQNRP
jgi:hypothetical protein